MVEIHYGTLDKDTAVLLPAVIVTANDNDILLDLVKGYLTGEWDYLYIDKGEKIEQKTVSILTQVEG